jgi:hypothetical protein
VLVPVLVRVPVLVIILSFFVSSKTFLDIIYCVIRYLPQSLHSRISFICIVQDLLQYISLLFLLKHAGEGNNEREYRRTIGEQEQEYWDTLVYKLLRVFVRCLVGYTFS